MDNGTMSQADLVKAYEHFKGMKGGDKKLLQGKAKTAGVKLDDLESRLSPIKTKIETKGQLTRKQKKIIRNATPKQIRKMKQTGGQARLDYISSQGKKIKSRQQRKRRR